MKVFTGALRDMIASDGLRKILDFCRVDPWKLTTFDEYVLSGYYRELKEEIVQDYSLDYSDCIYTESDLEEAEEEAKRDVSESIGNDIEDFLDSKEFKNDVSDMVEEMKLDNKNFDDFFEDLKLLISEKIDFILL